jgi:hypothetical protein
VIQFFLGKQRRHRHIRPILGPPQLLLSFKRHMYEADQQCKGRAPRGILYASDAQMSVRGTPEAHSNDLECPVAVKIPLNTYLF